MIIRGTPKPDVLNGTSESDDIYGLGGNDYLFGGGGSDHLWGGAGADYLSGGDGFDVAHYDDAPSAVYVRLDTGAGYVGDAVGDTLVGIEGLSGSAFNDILVGNGMLNNIWGNDGDDWIFGLGDPDVLYGGNGNDQIWGGGALDYIYGDAGFDFARYDYATTGVDVRLDERTPVVGLAPGGGWSGDEASEDQIWGCEGIVGSKFDDHLVGADPSSTVAPDNVLMGLDGNDELIGKGGNDSLFGGAGADRLDGGADFDLARYEDSNEGVWVSLATGYGYTGFASHDVLIDIEGLTGSSYDDLLIGNAGANLLAGNGGNDVLEGGVGADLIDGGDGVDVAQYQDSAAGITVDLGFGTGVGGEAAGDRLYGIEGIIGSAYGDMLTGSSADNMLRGGAGADILTGAWGNDQFVYERDDLRAGVDTIADYGVVAGDTDTLVFHGLTMADLTLTSDATGTHISVNDPSFAGGILVIGRAPAELTMLFT